MGSAILTSCNPVQPKEAKNTDAGADITYQKVPQEWI